MTVSILSTATGRARVPPIVMFGMFGMLGTLGTLGISAGGSLFSDGDRWGANHMPAFAHADTAAAAA